MIQDVSGVYYPSTIQYLHGLGLSLAQSFSFQDVHTSAQFTYIYTRIFTITIYYVL